MPQSSRWRVLKSAIITPQMRNTTIVLLLVAVGTLGYLVHSMNAILTNQQRQISNLTTKAKASTLELQAKCATQAARVF
jgi:hypothetical protein